MNLDFLYQVSNEELRCLCDIIIKDKEGNLRPTEELSSTTAFKAFYPHNMKRLVPFLIDELRLYGGNSIVNFFRGEGPPYSEILKDVANFFDVYYSSWDHDEEVESRILDKISNDWRTSSLGRNQYRLNSDQYLPIAVQQFLMAVSGRTIPGVVSGLLPSMVSTMLNPLGWAAAGLLALFQISRPSYKVTVPAVIYISYLRRRYGK